MKSFMLIIIFSINSALAQIMEMEGDTKRVPVDENSVGCGIVKGRLIYQSKTADEESLILGEMQKANRISLLETVAKRYSDTFHEDKGYYVEASWNLYGGRIDLTQFEVSFPGMRWSTNQGHLPENLSLEVLDDHLIMKFKIDSLNYCLADEEIKLRVASQEFVGATQRFRAKIKSELTLR